MATRNSGPEALRALEALLHNGEPPTMVPGNMVDFHIRSIFRKVDVTSRVDLTRQILSQATIR